jgi:putative ABC transport system permease protein
MSLLRTIKLAWEGLALNKVRSFLTTLGVIIGVGAVILMLAISSGAEADIADRINALGSNLIMVSASMSRTGVAAGQPPTSNGLTYDDITAIEQNVTGISGVAAEQPTTQNVKGGETTLESVSILGTTVGFTEVRDYDLAIGRFLSEEDLDRSSKVAILGSSIAAELFPDTNAVGQTIKVGSIKLTVVGVMAEKGTVGNTDFDERIYVPLTLVFDKWTNQRFGGDEVRTIYVSAEIKTVMDSVMSQVTALLIQRHDTTVDSPGFTLTTQDSIISTAASTTSTFRNLLSWVAAVSLLVGGIGIMNIMLVSVTERTREIGLRQALGARPWDVQLQFLLEAVTLSLIGGLLGVLAGVGGAYVTNALGSMRAQLVSASIPLAFGAAALVGIFFGYYPATKAAQLDPIVALRRE